MKMLRMSFLMLLAMAAVSPRVAKALPLTVVVEVEPQVKDDLFAGTEKFAQGAKEATEVSMDQNMLKMMGKGKDSEKTSKLEFIVVRSYEYEKPGMYRMEDFEVYRRKLMDGSWNCSIRVKEKDGSTDICSRAGANGEVSDMVLMVAEPRELTFIHMRGRGLSFDDLGKMGGVSRRRLPTPIAPPAPPAPPAPARAPLAPR